MADDKLYLLYLLYLRLKKRKIVKQFWLHPIVKVRYIEGTYYTLFEKLEKDPNKFYNYFRMSLPTFNYILSHLINDIKRQDTRLRLSIPPQEMLVVTLRYLASGCTLTDLHYNYRIGITTARVIVQKVCVKIWEILSNKHIPKPTQETWTNIAKNFEKTANFPVCLGAIDGKHIRIENFAHEGSMYGSMYNYKKYFSMVLLAIADSDYKFTFVDIGGYGKDCDSSLFQHTTFWKLLCERKLNIPHAKPLPPESIKVPYVFVADDAFPLNEHILKGFSGHNLTVPQRIFNYRLCRARRFVECAFGILTHKWRIFHRALNVSKQSAQNIVKACVVLHNIVRERDGYRENELLKTPQNSCFQSIMKDTTIPTLNKTGRGIGTYFTNYFVCEQGSLPWQPNKI